MGIMVGLARLLEPSAFGLMGMLALFMGLANVLADFGLSASLIQKRTLTSDDETSVCVINIAAGIVLAGLMCAMSPLVGRFYHQPVLVPMMCVQSLSIVVSSVCIVQSALLSRSMQFHKTAAIGTAGTIAGGGLGLVMAYLGYGVWSLVGSVLFGSLVRAALYWTLSSWRPRGRLRLECIRSMWAFSSYLLYCNLIGITSQNLYSAVIGKVYSPESLGYYDRANNLRMLPTGVMAGIVRQVAFPLFSRCQDDKPQLLRRIREIVRGSLMLSAGGLTLLALVADPLVPLVLSEKWRPAVPLLRILCYAGVLYPIHTLFLMALQAQGHSNLNFRLETIKAVNAIVAVSLVYRYGVTALAWSVVVLTAIAYFLNAWYNVKLLEYRWSMQARDIIPTLALCFISGWSAWWLGTAVPAGSLVVLVLRASAFFAFCGIGISCFRKRGFDDVWKHLTWASGWLRMSASRL